MPITVIVWLLVVVFDQVTKYLAQRLLAQGPVPVIRGIFHLTLACNQGAAFSILQGGTVFFVAVSILCIAAIMVMLGRPQVLKNILGLDAADKTVRVAFGLILGGACGNLIDRLRFACVIDFLDFRIWPVFNLADSAITIGGILIGYKMLTMQKVKR